MKIFERVLKRLVTRGQLTVHYAKGGSFTAGRADPEFPNLALRFHDSRVPFDIVKDPRLEPERRIWPPLSAEQRPAAQAARVDERTLRDLPQ